MQLQTALPPPACATLPPLPPPPPARSKARCDVASLPSKRLPPIPSIEGLQGLGQEAAAASDGRAQPVYAAHGAGGSGSSSGARGWLQGGRWRPRGALPVTRAPGAGAPRPRRPPIASWTCDARAAAAPGPEVARPTPAACSPRLQAKKTDYMELPQPVRYEELQREVMSESGAPRRRRRLTAGSGRRRGTPPLPLAPASQSMQPAPALLPVPPGAAHGRVGAGCLSLEAPRWPCPPARSVAQAGPV